MTQLIDPATDATVRAYTERSNGEDHVLDALDSIAGRIRADLGESLKQIHSSDQPLPQVTTSSLTALKLYAEAQSLWSHTKYDEAVSLYKSAIELDPDFAMAHAALGRAYCSHIYYQVELCRQEYGKAQSLGSRLTEREKMLLDARAALDLGRAEEAYRLYSSFLARYPEDWAVLREYANLLRRHGRVLDAMEQHKRILAIAPDDAHTWIEMATANSTLGSFSDAVQEYSQAFRIEPDLLTSGNVNREYGMALVGNGEEQRAVTVFSDLLQNPARREVGLCSLAMLDLFHGRYNRAQGRFQDALLIDESAHNSFDAARVHFWLAVIAEGRGDNRTRLRELDRSVADLKNLGPKVAWGALVGQEYVRAGALSKAEAIAGFITPLADPHDDEQMDYVRLLRASIAADQGQTAGATQQLLLLSDPAHGPSVNGLAMETLAYTYQRAGELDQAISQYEKFAAPLNPLTFWEPQQRWAVSRYIVASDYVKHGQPDKAKQTLALLLELWKDSDADLPLREAALELQTQLAHYAE